MGDEYLEIEGVISISHDESVKEKVWNKHMKPWFSGPEDSNLLILKVEPESIRLMNKNGVDPIVITP